MTSDSSIQLQCAVFDCDQTHTASLQSIEPAVPDIQKLAWSLGHSCGMYCHRTLIILRAGFSTNNYNLINVNGTLTPIH